MTRGVAVACAFGVVQGVIDHGPAEDRRRQRALSFQRGRGGRQDFIEIAVPSSRVALHEHGGSVERGPTDQKMKSVQMVLGAHREVERALLGFDIIEIGQPLEISAQMIGAKRTLETSPAEGLSLL